MYSLTPNYILVIQFVVHLTYTVVETINAPFVAVEELNIDMKILSGYLHCVYYPYKLLHY